NDSIYLFFQAEDGIRHRTVTGVQTCALPIYIYLCTNGMFIRKRLREFQPTSRLFFNVHLDGLEKTHDLCVEREGVFKEAIEGIQAAKQAGFLVCTNTTLFRQTDLREIRELIIYLT